MRTLRESILDTDLDTVEKSIPSLKTPLAKALAKLILDMKLEYKLDRWGFESFEYDRKTFVDDAWNLFKRYGKKISKATARKRSMFAVFMTQNYGLRESDFSFWVNIDEDIWHCIDVLQSPQSVTINPCTRLKMSYASMDSTYYELPEDVLALFDFIFKTT